MTPRRLLPSLALAALAVGLSAGTAAADLTAPTFLPTAGVSSVPIESPTLPAPTGSTAPAEPVAAVMAPVPVSSPALAATPAPSTSSSRTTADGPSLPRVHLSEPPRLPSPHAPPLPVAGGGQAPSGGSSGPGGSTGSSRTSGSPLGDDVLPAAVEDELCTILTALLGPLPAQITGVPASVIGQLPAQITGAVPADVLRTVTLRCPQAARDTLGARSAATEVLAAAPARPAKSIASKRAAATTRTSSTRSSALPHTGFVAGLPVAALTLLVLGTLLRRRAEG